MDQLQTFNPTNYAQLVAGIIYYLLVIVATFFSISSIYVLIRHGESKSLGFIVSVVYMIIYLSLVAQGTHVLGLIK